MNSDDSSIPLQPTVYNNILSVQAGGERNENATGTSGNNDINDSEPNNSYACIGSEAIDLREDADLSWKMSLPKATFTLLCQLIGGSDLTLPYAVSQGGIIVLVLLAILPFFCCYTALILVKCMYKTNRITGQKERIRSTYSDLLEACWHGHGRKLMFFLHSLVLVLVSSLYLLLSGSFLTNVFKDLPMTKRMWTAVGTFVIFPFTFYKSLSKLAWVSVLGVVVILIPIGITLCYSFAMVAQWNIEDLVHVKMEGIPVGMSIVIFTYGGHSILPRIESGMLKPENYHKVIFYNYILCAILKFTLAFVGFLMFSSSDLELVTSNLPSGVWTVIVSCSLGLKVLLSYPFLIYVVCNEIEYVITINSTLDQLISPLIRFFFIRIVVVLLTLCIALGVPQFGMLVAFIGSIGASLMVFILPGLFNLMLRHRETGAFEKFLDVFVIVLGLFSGVFGLYFTSKALVLKYNS